MSPMATAGSAGDPVPAIGADKVIAVEVPATVSTWAVTFALYSVLIAIPYV